MGTQEQASCSHWKGYPIRLQVLNDHMCAKPKWPCVQRGRTSRRTPCWKGIREQYSMPHTAPMASASSRHIGRATARLWDVKTAKQIAVLSGHRSAVHSAAYIPNGKRILTAPNNVMYVTLGYVRGLA
jgi:hypothetical protein